MGLILTGVRKYATWIALAIVLIAIAIRVIGIGTGLPYSQMPEESADMSSAFQMVTGDDPRYAFHRVGWPLSQIPVHGVHFLILKFIQPDFGFDDFQARYFTHRSEFILSIRLYLALLMGLSVGVVYLATRRLFDSELAGLVSALLITVQPWHLYMSYIAWPDGYSMLWIAIVLLACVYMIKERPTWAYVLAGVGVAVVILARLQAISLGLGVIAAYIWEWLHHQQRTIQYLLTHWLWILAGFVITMLVLNPYIILDPPAVLADLQFIFGNRYDTEMQASVLGSSMMMNARLMVSALRPYLAFVSIASLLGLLVFRDWDAIFAVGFFAVIFVFSLLPAGWLENHFFLPVIIPAVMIIGGAVAHLTRPTDLNWQHVVTIIVLIIVSGLSSYESYQILRIHTRPDTRVAAYEWVIDNLPDDSRIMIGETLVYSVALPRNIISIERARLAGYDLSSMAYYHSHPEQIPSPAYDLYGVEFKSAIQNDQEWWAFVEDNEIDYVIEAFYCFGDSYSYDIPSDLQFPVISAVTRSRLEELVVISPFDSATCMHTIPEGRYLRNFELDGWQHTGPLIRVYRIPE